MSRKLGRITPQHRPVLKAKDFFETGAVAPTEVHNSDRSVQWQMFGNGPDPGLELYFPQVAKFGVGNCVPCRILHAIQHEAISAGNPVPAFREDAGINLYSYLTGFDASQTDPETGANPTDRGTDPTQADTYWRTNGVLLPDGTTHKIAAYLDISPLDANEWGLGIAEFDYLGVGLNLTASALTDTYWQDKPNDPVIDGHEIMVNSYDAMNTNVNCWGPDANKLVMSREYLVKRCDQMTVYLSQGMINTRTGVSKHGFNYDKLAAAYAQLTGE